MSEIIRATQSPLNLQRWCVDLSCGHEMWITSKCRPKRNVSCDECERERRRMVDEKKGKRDG